MNNEWKNSYNEDLRDKEWMGVIVDITDPLNQGRVKIRVFEKFDQRKPSDDNGEYPDEPLSFDDYLDESNFIIPTADLPWIFPAQSTIFGGGENPGYGSFSTPKIKSLVRVDFPNNDIYSGVYYTLVRANAGMMEQLAGDYTNAHVILWDEDEDLKIIYQQNLGLQLFHKGSQVVIKPDSSIFIEHKDTESMMELKGPDIKIVSNRDIDITSQNKVTVNSDLVHVNGSDTYLGESPNFSAVNGEPLMNLLKVLATMIDAKTAPTPGIAALAVDSTEKLILSKTVKTSL